MRGSDRTPPPRSPCRLPPPPPDLLPRLSAHPARRAGSDAERRAALDAAALLRAQGGRRVRVSTATTWVRPRGALVHALVSLAGVVASVLAVSSALPALVVAAVAVLVLAGDVTGRLPLLRLVTPARATEVAEARDRRDDAPVRLVLAAGLDQPGAGLLDAGALPRFGARLRGRRRGLLPGPLGWTALALVLVAAAAGARLAGAEGRWLGAAQLVPTVGLVLLGALLLERALVGPRGAGTPQAAGAAAALELARRLRAAPPRALAVDVVVAGAGEPEGLGAAAWRDARRRDGLRAEQVAVLALGPVGAGAPAWVRREGLVRGLAPHPSLAAHARALAADHGAEAMSARTASAARIGRARRWPGLALRTTDAAPTRVDPAALEALVAYAEAVVRALDDELAPPPAATVRRSPAPSSARARRRAGGTAA